MEASDAPYDRGSELAPSGYYLASRVPIHGLVVPRMRTCSRRPCGLLILAVYFRFRSLFFFFVFHFGLLAFATHIYEILNYLFPASLIPLRMPSHFALG